MLVLLFMLIFLGAALPASPIATTREAASKPVPATQPVRRTLVGSARVYQEALAKAREQYLQAQLAAKRTYQADLSVAISTAMKNGNLEQADQAKAVRENVVREAEQLSAELHGKSLMPAGKWDVNYSNGAHHVCRIAPDGAWEKLDGSEHPATRLKTNEAGDMLLIFSDGNVVKTERHTLTPKNVLIVEHWNPSSAYGNGPPTAIGVGYPVP